jgi:hypothetical protein
VALPHLPAHLYLQTPVKASPTLSIPLSIPQTRSISASEPSRVLLLPPSPSHPCPHVPSPLCHSSQAPGRPLLTTTTTAHPTHLPSLRALFVPFTAHSNIMFSPLACHSLHKGGKQNQGCTCHWCVPMIWKREAALRAFVQGLHACHKAEDRLGGDKIPTKVR